MDRSSHDSDEERGIDFDFESRGDEKRRKIEIESIEDTADMDADSYSDSASDSYESAASSQSEIDIDDGGGSGRAVTFSGDLFDTVIQLLSKTASKWVNKRRSEGVSPKEALEAIGIRVSEEELKEYEGKGDGEGEGINTLWAMVEHVMVERLLHAESSREQLADVDSISAVIEKIQNAQNIIVLCGAGISVAAGIPDFRSTKTGLYAKLRNEYGISSPEAVFDIHVFKDNPQFFYSFAAELWPGKASPTATHRFIQLLSAKKKLLRCYTQNIDGLELRSGVEREKVIHCHGSFATASCMKCGRSVSGDEIVENVEQNTVPWCTVCERPPWPSRAGEDEGECEGEKEKEKEGKKEDEGEGDADPDMRMAPRFELENQEESEVVMALRGDIAETVELSLGEGEGEGEGKGEEQSGSHGESRRQIPTPIQIIEPKDEAHNTATTTTTAAPVMPVMKPDVVFFGQPLPSLFRERIMEDYRVADLVLVMGSSLQVQPVASVPGVIPHDVPQILINRELVAQPHVFDAYLLGDLDSVITDIADRLGWKDELSVKGEGKGSGEGEGEGEKVKTIETEIDIEQVTEHVYVYPGGIRPSMYAIPGHVEEGLDDSDSDFVM